MPTIVRRGDGKTPTSKRQHQLRQLARTGHRQGILRLPYPASWATLAAAMGNGQVAASSQSNVGCHEKQHESRQASTSNSVGVHGHVLHGLEHGHPARRSKRGATSARRSAWSTASNASRSCGSATGFWRCRGARGSGDGRRSGDAIWPAGRPLRRPGTGISPCGCCAAWGFACEKCSIRGR